MEREKKERERVGERMKLANEILCRCGAKRGRFGFGRFSTQLKNIK